MLIGCWRFLNVSQTSFDLQNPSKSTASQRFTSELNSFATEGPKRIFEPKLDSWFKGGRHEPPVVGIPETTNSKSHPNQLGTSCRRHVAVAIVRPGCDLDAASAVHVLGIPRSLDLSRQIVILVKTREDLKRGVHVHLRYSFVLNVKTR